MGEGGWGLEILKRAKNQSAAIEFARFMTTYEAQFCYSQIYSRSNMPACRPMMTSAIYAGDSPTAIGTRRALTANPNTTFKGHGYDPSAEVIIQNMIKTIREGKITPKDAAAQLQTSCTDQQKRYDSK
jgi:ABC-type glycerol-3-phosphate transport system substrate-binding protein